MCRPARSLPAASAACVTLRRLGRAGVADGIGGTFDSALLLGNNLGLLGSPENAPRFLTAVRHTRPDLAV